MDDICWVHEVDGAKRVVQNGGNVIFWKKDLWLRAQQLLHITFNKLHNNEDVIEIFKVWSSWLNFNIVVKLHDRVWVFVCFDSSLISSLMRFTLFIEFEIIFSIFTSKFLVELNR